MSRLIALIMMNGDYSLPVNLGNLEEHTIKEFAKIVQKEIGNYTNYYNSEATNYCRQTHAILDSAIQF